MDINDFSLDTEYFGFGAYKRSPKSNLDFLNFTKIEETEEFKKEVRFHDDMVDNIRNSGKPLLQIQMELEAENKRFEEAIKKIKRDRLVGGAAKGLASFGSFFDKATSALGISNKGGVSGDAPINVSYNKDKNGDKPKSNTLLIVGGLVVATGLGFLIYKLAKK